MFLFTAPSLLRHLKAAYTPIDLIQVFLFGTCWKFLLGELLVAHLKGNGEGSDGEAGSSENFHCEVW